MADSATPVIHSPLGKAAAFARDIKLSHTVFAMPWALLSTVMAWKTVGGPVVGKVLLILAAMVGARTFAMAANQLIDAAIDARNPRTAGRAIPSGRLTRGFVLSALAASSVVFVTAAAAFYALYRNPWPAILCLPVLAYLAGYPLTKRFTRLCHWYLGAALGLAPICAWLAMAGRVDSPPLWMAGAVLFWTAGFDIIYACQDWLIDVEQGLRSVPSGLGVGGALWVARACHIISLGMMLGLARSPMLGTAFLIAVAATAGLLVVEHLIVRPGNLARVNLAFFTLNGIISLTLGAVGIADVLW